MWKATRSEEPKEKNGKGRGACEEGRETEGEVIVGRTPLREWERIIHDRDLSEKRPRHHHETKLADARLEDITINRGGRCFVGDTVMGGAA